MEKAVTTFYLVRHASYALLGQVLAGGTLDVCLDQTGQRQVETLAKEFARRRQIGAVQSSPRRRALQTAGPIAERVGRPLEVEQALDEVDFGEWSGRRFAELGHDARWRAWNESRGKERAPGGESMAEVQRRVVAHLERVRDRVPGAMVVVVSHCDVIRAALLHYRGQPLDAYAGISIPPAAVTILRLAHCGHAMSAGNEATSA
jgi:broad specificity phosphatase PhoE